MLEYYEEMENGSFLEHHGILGQKWGIRRFQNYDGTLKAAGKRRVKTDRDKERAERKAAKAQAKAEKKEAKEEEARKNLRSEIDKAIANVDFKKISELKGQMTDDDLLKLSKRAQALGKTAENLDKYKKGLPPSTFDKVIKGLGAVKTGADAVANAHKAFKDLRKEFGLDAASILNDSSDGQMTISDWMKNKDPDIFDRIKETTGKIAKDAANKASEAHQQRKYEKQLKETSDRIKDNETLDWLKNISGTKREENESDEVKQRKLQASVSGHGKIDQGFKLKDGDYGIFKQPKFSTSDSLPKFNEKLDRYIESKTGKAPEPAKPKANFDSGFKLGSGDYSIFSSATRDTKVSDLPKPRNITLPKGSGSKPISEVLKDLDDLTSDLSDNNRRRLGL